MIYWKYIYKLTGSDSYEIWERNPETKQERCVYASDDDNPYDKWVEWESDSIEDERILYKQTVEVISKDQVFLEMI